VGAVRTRVAAARRVVAAVAHLVGDGVALALPVDAPTGRDPLGVGEAEGSIEGPARP
jgi:hypothetical protein